MRLGPPILRRVFGQSGGKQPSIDWARQSTNLPIHQRIPTTQAMNCNLVFVDGNMYATAPAHHHFDASKLGLPVAMGEPVKAMPVALAESPASPVLAQAVPKPCSKAKQAFLDKGHSEEEWEAKQAIKKAKAKANKVAKDKKGAKELARLHKIIRELKNLLRNPPKNVDQAIEDACASETESEGEAESEAEVVD